MKSVLVTGTNKGIGLEVVNQLLKLNYFVVLTARNMNKGLESAEKFKDYASSLKFIRMDVADEESIRSAAKEFNSLNLKLDVLVNNAGILVEEENIIKTRSEDIISTFRTNALGPILVIQHFLPFMNNNGRIINVSSGLGLSNSMSDYAPSYSISKAALNAVTKQFSFSLADKNISGNAMSPGWVRTDMGGSNAERPIEKGAETIVWLADEAPQKLTGKYFVDKKEMDW